MPLRSLRYLNRDEFFTQAAYHDLKVPTEATVTESTEKTREGKAGLEVHGVGASGGRGSSVKVQMAYSVNVPEKAAMSKILDQLETMPEVLTKLGDGEQNVGLSAGQLIEIPGTLALSPVSKAGKVFEMVHQTLTNNPALVMSLMTGAGNQEPTAELMETFQKIYLSNELLPIPTLYELTDHPLEDRAVYVNCAPGHFVGNETARTTDAEGPGLVIGTVRELITADKNDGYLSTAPWTLHSWEPSLRNMLEHQLDDLLEQMTQGIGETFIGGTGKLHYLEGPAVVIDALSITDPLPTSTIPLEKPQKKRRWRSRS